MSLPTRALLYGSPGNRPRLVRVLAYVGDGRFDILTSDDRRATVARHQLKFFPPVNGSHAPSDETLTAWKIGGGL